jgi:hypothetical protein
MSENNEHTGTLKRCGNGVSTTVFQSCDKGGKWRIHKLQQRSVSLLLIYYDELEV